MLRSAEHVYLESIRKWTDVSFLDSIQSVLCGNLQLYFCSDPLFTRLLLMYHIYLAFTDYLVLV